MDVIYRRGQVTVAEVRQSLPDPPSYSAVRAMLRVLEDKGHVKHQEQDLRYVYLSTVPRERARRSALRHLIETFFDGSSEQAVAGLLDASATRLSSEELDRLTELIEKAKKEGMS